MNYIIKRSFLKKSIIFKKAPFKLKFYRNFITSSKTLPIDSLITKSALES